MATKYLHGGWYNGKQWNANTQSFGDVGVINNPDQQGYGQKVSNEVIAQTNPNNVSYIDSQIKASQLQAPVNIPLPSNSSSNFMSGLNASVEAARKALETNLGTRKSENDAKLTQVKQKEQETLGKIGELSTPFREDIEKTQRETLHINKNFEENQKLVDELDQLLTEGNDLIRQQQSVTGIAAIRNPRIQQTMNDVAARAGVIQAVMAARNSQISVAENFIDRTVNAIAQDRNDQLNYYNTILTLNNQDKLSLDADNKAIAQAQIALLQGDLEQAQATANYLKQMMLDPAKAQLIADSGVTLNDSVEAINQKLARGTYLQEVRDITNEFVAMGATTVSNPSSVPAKQLKQYTDSRGVVHYFKMPAEPVASFTKSTIADSWLGSTVAKPDAIPTTQPSSPLTSVSPQVYSSIFDIALEVSGQSGSAQLKK